jgi:glycosyltransferase involved in cell wall biosynthesis
MRKITLGTTYYNCPDLLNLFLEKHKDYFDEIIIVDDGSDISAENYIKDRDKIKLYRVPIDYGFNSHGCRNLIMKETTNDWVVLLDVDRLFIDPNFAVSTIKNANLNESVLYLFEMFLDYKTNKAHHASVNDFLVNKNHFWKAGGYDEELIGIRAGDREFRKQLLNFGKEKIFYGIYAEFTRPPSWKVNAESKKDKKHEKRKKILLEKRIRKPDPNKPTLTFEWHRVF